MPVSDLAPEELAPLVAPRAAVAGVATERPSIMGILNVTPDSFSDGGAHRSLDAALAQAERMAAAEILDVGGESTRPGAATVGADEEAARILPVIEALRGRTISVDTRKAAVARAALAAGAGIVNDVSALGFDPAMASTVAASDAPICLMHSGGPPDAPHDAPPDGPDGDAVALDVFDALARAVDRAVAAGIARARIVVDPGIGFGKSHGQNVAILARIGILHGLGVPILLGASRKGFIGTVSGERQAPARVPGTLAVTLAAVAQGVQMHRVHDVAEIAQGLALWRAVTGGDVMRLFGTDGVRGRANEGAMTAETALRLGAAAGRYFRREGGGHAPHRVVIGKDTRLSGYMLETAMTAGLTSTGMNVLLLGPVPTPAVGLLARSMRADLGVMISASHNPATDNGIKFFGPDGFKLSDEAEAEIERMVADGVRLAEPERIGRAKRIDDGRGRYVEYAKTTIPSGMTLEGLRVVVDCANGAAYRAAPDVLGELGATVIAIGVAPDGHNINERCGSTHPEAAAAAIREHGADVGIALDGDADRVMILDADGRVGDGDQLMALLAARWAEDGRLRGDALVATVMSNLGLERFLAARGIGLHRTGVGDRHVVEAMRAGGYNLGGEQSGHVVMTDYATTGDGLIAGLQFLSEMVRTGRSAAELMHSFQPVPQRLENVRFGAGARPLEAAGVRAAIAEAEGRLSGTGRLLIRASGTEPLIRVMAEAEDEGLLHAVVDDVANAVRAAV